MRPLVGGKREGALRRWRRAQLRRNPSPHNSLTTQPRPHPSHPIPSLSLSSPSPSPSPSPSHYPYPCPNPSQASKSAACVACRLPCTCWSLASRRTPVPVERTRRPTLTRPTPPSRRAPSPPSVRWRATRRRASTGRAWRLSRRACYAGLRPTALSIGTQPSNPSPASALHEHA